MERVNGLKMYEISGTTYNAKELLKNAGFVYDKKSKKWHGDQTAMIELQRVSTATYSRANQKLVAGLKIKEVGN